MKTIHKIMCFVGLHQWRCFPSMKFCDRCDAYRNKYKYTKQKGG